MNTRLQTVDIPKGALTEEKADEVAKMDDQSTIGALSWLGPKATEGPALAMFNGSRIDSTERECQ